MSFLSRLLGKNEAAHTGGHLYAAIGSAARHPAFFDRYRVPDTLDGRFDMLMLVQGIISLVLMRRGEQVIVREMQEQLIRDMDRNLREAGVGDLSVGKQIKAMSSSLLGSQSYYHKAFGENDPATVLSRMEEAIRRNIYKEDKNVPAADLALFAVKLFDVWQSTATKDLAKNLPVDGALDALPVKNADIEVKD